MCFCAAIVDYSVLNTHTQRLLKLLFPPPCSTNFEAGSIRLLVMDKASFGVLFLQFLMVMQSTSLCLR
jgi:hypothetical protein